MNKLWFHLFLTSFLINVISSVPLSVNWKVYCSHHLLLLPCCFSVYLISVKERTHCVILKKSFYIKCISSFKKKIAPKRRTDLEWRYKSKVKLWSKEREKGSVCKSIALNRNVLSLMLLEKLDHFASAFSLWDMIRDVF